MGTARCDPACSTSRATASERVLLAMARLNIDERLTRVSEEQGKLVIKVMVAAFAEIGLSQETQAAVRPVIARHVRLAAAEEREQGLRELSRADRAAWRPQSQCRLPNTWNAKQPQPAGRCHPVA